MSNSRLHSDLSLTIKTYGTVIVT